MKTAGAPADFVETVYGIGYRLKPAAGEEHLSKEVHSHRGLSGVGPSGSPSERLPSDQASISDSSLADPTLVKLRRQQTQVALATLWRSVKGQQRARLEALQQAISQLQCDNLSLELRQAAYRSAHSLTGVLGIFGSKKGSYLADQIQTLLQGEAVILAADKLRLKELVGTLSASLDDAMEQHQSIEIKTLKMPLLLLVDPQLEITPTLVSSLWAKGFTVKISQEIAALSTMLAAVNDETSKSQPACIKAAIPDIILLNFAFDHAGAGALDMLSALMTQLPSLMMMICSADGSLSSRMKASQFGDYPFLFQPKTASVIKTIELLRSHSAAKKQKILAVDDDPQLLQALQTRLEPEGYQIVTLDSPVEFWQTLQTESPDLLLLDISMPEFTGIELCQTVRQAPAWHHLPIVMFTSHTDAHTQQVALRAGADNLIEKSTPDSQLFSYLSRQIKRSHLQQAIQQANQ